MIKSNLVIGFLMALASMSCQSEISELGTVEVLYSGALKKIMSGDVSAQLRLDSLKRKDHLYALGAIENLKGEIQIFDGLASHSMVQDNELAINDSFDLNAALLVYAQVAEWREFRIDETLNASALETRIYELAKTNQLDTSQPFPFLIEGKVTTLDWHVIDWAPGDMVHNHEKHKASGLHGTLRDRAVVILGFYSTKHKAIFTHHTTNMHMHFKTLDNTMAGHVDDLKVNSVMIKLAKTDKMNLN